jgi:hypothetical protein
MCLIKVSLKSDLLDVLEASYKSVLNLLLFAEYLTMFEFWNE